MILITSIIAFLGVALLFYVLFAGADFGGGILELFLGKNLRKEQRALVTRAMAPVWEANHVWLVLAIVILFMGFPSIYTTMSVSLHLPLMAVLVGIVFRGCAFTFRHYDTYGKEFFSLYSRAFALSSVWTSFFLGVLGGAMIFGRIDPRTLGFAESYVAPWLNLFCLAMGLFTVCLFAFLAAVFLTGEADTRELRAVFRRKAALANGALIVTGALVFAFAEWGGHPLTKEFFASPLSLTCFVTASILWFPFWRSLRREGRGPTLSVRVIGVAIVALVLFGWYAVQFPVAVRFADGTGLNFYTEAAPGPTLNALLVALIAGTLLIFPALGYLFKVFKWETLEQKR